MGDKFYKAIEQMIIKILKRELKKMGYTKIITGTVADVTIASGSSGGVYFYNDTSSALTLKNATSATLNQNDEVKIIMPNGDLTNAFIGWKK